MIIDISTELTKTLENGGACIDSTCNEGNVFVTYIDVEGSMSEYEFCAEHDGTEKEFVLSFINELNDFDAVSNAVDEINNGCIAETDDIRWYADAADELEDMVSCLKDSLEEYCNKQGW